MSTKTSIKRIALVVVSTLGFGLMTSIAPASAGAIDGGTVTATIGAVSRQSVNTWEATATITVASPVDGEVDGAADDTIAVTATETSTGTAVISVVSGSGDLTGGNYVLTAADATAGTVTFEATIRFTAVTDTTIANVAAAAATYVVTISAGGVADGTPDSVVIGSTATGSFLTGTAYAGSRSALTQITSGQATVEFVAGTSDTSYTVTSSGVGTMLSASATTTAPVLLGATTATGFTWTPVTTVQKVSILVSSTTAGTTTLTFQPVGASGVPGIPVTATVTWVAAPAVSTAYSTAYIAQGAAAGTSATNLLGASLVRTAGGQVANITVTLKDASNVAISGKPLAASISGSGVIAISDTNTTYNATNAGARIVSIAAMADNVANIAVYADGTAGTGTITITSGTTTIATKTVTFYGTVAALNVTQNLSIARASAAGAALGCSAVDCGWTTVASTPAVYIEAVDAAGVIVPGLTISAVSSDVLVIASATINEDDATAGDGPGYYNASVTSAPNGVSGATATVTFRTQLSTGAYVTSTPVTFTLGGGAATHSLTLDKASYAPGEAMVVTRSAVDASGNPVYDGVTAPAVSFNKGIGGTAPAASEFIGGKKATSAAAPTVFAPAVDGAFEARMSGLNAAVAAVITASATVTDTVGSAAATAAADAAAEAIDAANAATDAANLAAEAADAATVAAEEARDAADAATAAVEELASQVATLMAALKAQITTLANTVAKIAKKVKA